MNKYFLLAAILVGSSLTSCSSDEEIEAFSNKTLPTELVASNATEDFSSRTGFEETTGKFFWSKGDVIGLLTTENSKKKFCAPYELMEGIGLNKGEFEAKDPTIGGTSLNFAVAPHNPNHKLEKISEGQYSLHYKFYPKYDYKQVDLDFFSSYQGEGNSFNIPMFGKVEADKNVSFKHIGGVFCVIIDKMPVAAGTLTFRMNGKKINGEYTTEFKTDERPVLLVEKINKEKEDIVTISFDNAAQFNTGVFYIPVPAGTYTKSDKADGFSLRIRIQDAESQYVYDYKANKTYTINPGSLQIINATNNLLE